MRFSLSSFAARLFTCALLLFAATAASALPFDTVFKGRDRFDALVRQAEAGNWKDLAIGPRTAAVGRALTGVPYKNYTIEIDDHVEAPSVNLLGLDCWTFFENSLAFARMLGEPRDQWTPETMLKYLEQDRYRGGHCTGEYLSRLHYLEDWVADNERRGLVKDMTRSLGGSAYPHNAQEMTILWRSYRYLRNNPGLLPSLRDMEERVTRMTLLGIPNNRIARIEDQLRDGDIIGIITKDAPGAFSTSHVGLAVRGNDGVLHFMHASAPRNYGKTLVDSRLSAYANHYRSNAAILVARPVK
jgi:hypothetical protein